jgi:hypothetical protein
MGPLASMLTSALFYENGLLRTIELKDHFRALAFDPEDRYVTLVGNYGKIIRMIKDETVQFDSGVQVHLRGVSANPTDGSLLIVGNAGKVLRFKETAIGVVSSLVENLRTVDWNATGTKALIGGNAGWLLKYSDDSSVTKLDVATANLRRISWHPRNNCALVTSNCFAEEFLPSPNLYLYDEESGELTPVNEGRVDLIGVDWHPAGGTALVVGYDILWHNGFIGQFDGEKITPIDFDNRQVYPVAVSWNYSGDLAAICTSVPQPGMGKGSLRIWDGKRLSTVFESKEIFFSAVSWNHHGTLIALGSTANRTFNS